MAKTKIVLIRKDSKGIEGTRENAKHHAEKIFAFIERLEPAVGLLGFNLWAQGHNVHEFRTTEGTRYTLRPFINDGQYVGIRLSLRASRSLEFRLIDITDPDDCWKLLDVMRLLAMPAKGNKSGVMQSDKAA